MEESSNNSLHVEVFGGNDENKKEYQIYLSLPLHHTSYMRTGIGELIERPIISEYIGSKSLYLFEGLDPWIVF